MTLKTDALQQVCDDLVYALKLKLCNPANSSARHDLHPDLVELIAQQYFMGTLSRLISLEKSVGIDHTPQDLESQDLHFNLSFPEDIDVAQVEIIRKEAAVLLARCFNSLKTKADTLPKTRNSNKNKKSKNLGKPS